MSVNPVNPTGATNPPASRLAFGWPPGVSVLPGTTFSVFDDEGDAMGPGNTERINSYNHRVISVTTWLAVAFTILALGLSIAAIAMAAYYSRKHVAVILAERQRARAAALSAMEEAPPAARARHRREDVCPSAVVRGWG